MFERAPRYTHNRYCANSKYTGIHVDGAFAEYEILDSRHLVELSNEMTFEQVTAIGFNDMCGLRLGGSTHLRWCYDLHCYQEGQSQAWSGRLTQATTLKIDHRYKWPRRPRSSGCSDGKSVGESPFNREDYSADEQELKVVGIDARLEPIEMTKGFKLAPDLVLDAGKISAKEAVKLIAGLREEEYEGWDGVDGESFWLF